MSEQTLFWAFITIHQSLSYDEADPCD